MMKQQWEKISVKVDAMSKRERVLIFGAGAVLSVALLTTLLFDPLFAKHKALRLQISQQQQLMNDIQSQIAAVLQKNSPSANLPQRNQLSQLRLEIAEGDAFLKSSGERLVQPEKMAEHLRKLLNNNNRLQIVVLRTLPVTPLLEQHNGKGAEQNMAAPAASPDKQMFKHGVQLTLRGNYLDLLQYLGALERLPQQMFWASAKMNVLQYPTAELTLILYTLSLDKTWLQI